MFNIKEINSETGRNKAQILEKWHEKIHVILDCMKHDYDNNNHIDAAMRLQQLQSISQQFITAIPSIRRADPDCEKDLNQLLQALAEINLLKHNE